MALYVREPMTDTTEEESRRCPSCSEAGILLNRRRVPHSPGIPQGTMLAYYECRNDRCPDYVPPTTVGLSTVIPGERYKWMRQENPDGTIPPKGSGGSGPKAFDLPNVNSAVAQRARDNLKYLAAQDERGGDSKEATEILRDLGGHL
jgi:hypothetical protein